MQPLRTRSLLVLVAAGLVLVPAACGSSGSDAADDPTTTEASADETTTTEAATTTVPAADDETIALAKAGIYTAEDLPDPWKVAREPMDYATEGIKEDDCSNPDGGAYRELGAGALQGGASYQRGDEVVYVGTTAGAFADEATATEWGEYLNSAEYEACRAEQLLENNADTEGLEVKPQEKPTGEMGVGSNSIVAINNYDFLVDGELSSQLYLTTYRVGRLLVTVQIDVGGIEMDALNTALGEEASARGSMLTRTGELQDLGTPDGGS